MRISKLQSTSDRLHSLTFLPRNLGYPAPWVSWLPLLVIWTNPLLAVLSLFFSDHPDHMAYIPPPGDITFRLATALTSWPTTSWWYYFSDLTAYTSWWCNFVDLVWSLFILGMVQSLFVLGLVQLFWHSMSGSSWPWQRSLLRCFNPTCRSAFTPVYSPQPRAVPPLIAPTSWRQSQRL